MDAGESATVRGEGLTVTYDGVVADNRCPPGVQCIVAGNATVSVTVAKTGIPPARLTLNTDDGARSARYGSYEIELLQLGFTARPAARLLVG